MAYHTYMKEVSKMTSKTSRLYPSTKFFWVLLMVIICMFTPGYVVQYMVFPLVILLSVFSKNTLKFVSVFMKSILVIVLFDKVHIIV